MAWLWAIILAVSLPMAASAGPWPRATGERFVSLSTSGQGYSLWGEYGLSRGQWLVVQGSLGQNSTGQASLAWWRQLGKGEGAHRVAMGFALGTQINSSEATPYLGVSTSWGMGLTRPFSGWVRLDFDSRIGMGLILRKGKPHLGHVAHGCTSLSSSAISASAQYTACCVTCS